MDSRCVGCAFPLLLWRLVAEDVVSWFLVHTIEFRFPSYSYLSHPIRYMEVLQWWMVRWRTRRKFGLLWRLIFFTLVPPRHPSIVSLFVLLSRRWNRSVFCWALGGIVCRRPAGCRFGNTLFSWFKYYQYPQPFKMQAVDGLHEDCEAAPLKWRLRGNSPAAADPSNVKGRERWRKQPLRLDITTENMDFNNEIHVFFVFYVTKQK